MMVGAYTAYSTTIDKNAQLAFEQAFEGFVGGAYEPLAVASQVVNGTNYSFFCNGRMVVPNSRTEGAMVSIHAPIDGKASVTSIHNTGR